MSCLQEGANKFKMVVFQEWSRQLGSWCLWWLCSLYQTSVASSQFFGARRASEHMAHWPLSGVHVYLLHVASQPFCTWQWLGRWWVMAGRGLNHSVREGRAGKNTRHDIVPWSGGQVNLLSVPVLDLVRQSAYQRKAIWMWLRTLLCVSNGA